MTGRLIVLEGIDGCGKSTQAVRLAERLRAEGREVLTPREPGGTTLGEGLRSILLDPATVAGAEAEALCYLAARAQLCRTVLAPALKRGAWIVLDRFWHSTVAYQGFGLGLDPLRLRTAIDFAVGPVGADAVLWIDVDPDECLRRRAHARPDRIESRGPEYLRRVHAGYVHLVAAGDLTRIPGDGTPEVVAGRVDAAIAGLL